MATASFLAVRSRGCLCGAVRFTAAPKDRRFGACHCSMCRRSTAGPSYDFANVTKTMTGTEVFAAFAAPGGGDGK